MSIITHEEYRKWTGESRQLWEEWDKTRPNTPSDFPCEEEAYGAGYLAACMKYEWKTHE